MTDLKKAEAAAEKILKHLTVTHEMGSKKIHREPSMKEDAAEARVEHVAFIVQHQGEARLSERLHRAPEVDPGESPGLHSSPAEPQLVSKKGKFFSRCCPSVARKNDPKQTLEESSVPQRLTGWCQPSLSLAR